MTYLETISDVATFVDNSGLADFEWGGNASLDGFTDWLWLNRSSVDPDSYDDDIREYLKSVGENPADYGM